MDMDMDIYVPEMAIEIIYYPFLYVPEMAIEFTVHELDMTEMITGIIMPPDS